MQRVATWWDGFELWLAGLPFVPQVGLVLVVAIPVCAGIAWVLDRAVAAGVALFGRSERAPDDMAPEPRPLESTTPDAAAGPPSPSVVTPTPGRSAEER